MRKQRLLLNTALLTASSLLMNAVAMRFQVWLVGRIGASGIGLYQLVLSCLNLAVTFAVSGIRFAATRLVAEELGLENRGGVRAAMERCLEYGAFFGLAAAVILWELAEPLGFLWIGDARTVSSLRIAAFSMPCVSLCSALSGYFTACGRVWKPTLVHLIEQAAGVGLVIFFLDHAPLGDLEKSCAAVTLGQTAADVLGLVLMALVYVYDRRWHYSEGNQGERYSARMLSIAVPLAVSAYARSALNTLRHLLVPRGLKAAGYSADGALAGYGTIQGMVLPILFFPACIMGAVAELMVPELTEAQVRGDREQIRRTTGALLKASLLFSGAVGLFLFLFAKQLGLAIYRSFEAGRYLRLLAPLVPVMYTDMAVDGCLKGLGEQVWSMGVNILDALTGLVLVWWLLPKYALTAYIGILYVTEGMNLVLSVLRLRSVTRFRPGPCGAGASSHRRGGAGERCVYTAGR